MAQHFSSEELQVPATWVELAMALIPPERHAEYRKRLVQTPRTVLQENEKEEESTHKAADFDSIALSQIPKFNEVAVTEKPIPQAEQEQFRGPNGELTWKVEDIWKNKEGEERWKRMIDEMRAEHYKFFRAEGKNTRRQIRSICTFDEKEYIHESMHSPRITDMSDLGALKAAKIGDQRVGVLNVEKFKEHLKGQHGDEEALYRMEFGWTGKQDLARGLAVMNVLQGATPHMHELDDIVSKEINDNTLTASYGYYPQTYPAIMSGVGVAFRKWRLKPSARMTWAADPLTIPEMDNEERPWAINGGHGASLPQMEWPKVKLYAEAGSVIYSAYRVIVKARPELKRILKPESCSFDYKGFYRQLFMALNARFQQAFFLAMPNGLGRFLTGDAMMFGGDEFPLQSMRVASLLILALMIKIKEFETFLQDEAQKGNPIAQQHAPEELQQILRKREQMSPTVGLNERPLAFAAQFIDDKLAVVLGVIRLIACMCAVWWITDDGNFKLAKPKTRCGQASTELGLQFEWANGRSKQPTDKFIICVEWAERIINLRKISHKELESAVSTLQFGVMGIDNGNIYLRRSFRALHVKKLWKGKFSKMKILGWLKADMRAHSNLMKEAAEVGGGKSFVAVSGVPRLMTGAVKSLTDACRKTRGFSGGGGIIVMPSNRAIIFRFQFQEEVAEVVPIHVLEFVCTIISLKLIAMLKPKARVVEFQDNMAVVWCCQLLSSADPRFHEGLILRDVVEREGELETQMQYIKSDDNDVADPASRNKLKEMRTNAEKHGWVVEKELELADLYQIIPDLEMLFIRLKEITLTMRNDDRSTDKW